MTRLRVRQCRKHMRGFTLVEVMVAVTIGLIILAAVAQIFSTSRATYGLEENLARVQENGRFAMQFLTRDLRMTGYAGCVNVNQALNADADFTVTNGLNNPTNFENTFAPALHIQGHEWVSANTWNPALPGFLAGFVNEQTDVLVIRRGAETSYPLSAAMGATNADISINETNDIELDDLILIGDCQNVDVAKVTTVTTSSPNEALEHAAANPGNTTVNLAKSYDADAEVMKLLTRVYFIGNGTGGEPALFMWDMDKGSMPAATRLERVESIESMQLLYGEDTDTDGSANIYRLPATVTDWSRVVSVRMGLLARTPAESGQDVDTNTYDVLSDTANNTDDFDPTDDKRQRRIFSSTIQIRNLRTD